LMQAVWQVEQAVRETMQPDKVNLASFGNVVPHLHWHVIPRFRDDRHFPQPVWGAAQRESDAQALAKRASLLPALQEAILRHARQHGRAA
jgi:diadenosine tetraphosphate (Ap4A) HIT family hydrolase